ncbi:LOW QUALITY PROTEIN: regulator of nonsense transcripts 1 homolog [Elysia marginata]|uniref:Regulator of nonsense transcripts 1 homolog n=1 Tax=Elysia marginata TaxID=1093978 RepID=A0AAV4IQF5_9GAST|nr:LOW QUALITY PROTEIN: regulator of nonsense transcripts 1 homolog [Elysia marginata]
MADLRDDDLPDLCVPDTQDPELISISSESDTEEKVLQPSTQPDQDVVLETDSVHSDTDDLFFSPVKLQQTSGGDRLSCNINSSIPKFQGFEQKSKTKRLQPSSIFSSNHQPERTGVKDPDKPALSNDQVQHPGTSITNDQCLPKFGSIRDSSNARSFQKIAPASASESVLNVNNNEASNPELPVEHCDSSSDEESNNSFSVLSQFSTKKTKGNVDKKVCDWLTSETISYGMKEPSTPIVSASSSRGQVQQIMQDKISPVFSRRSLNKSNQGTVSSHALPSSPLFSEPIADSHSNTQNENLNAALALLDKDLEKNPSKENVAPLNETGDTPAPPDPVSFNAINSREPELQTQKDSESAFTVSICNKPQGCDNTAIVKTELTEGDDGDEERNGASVGYQEKDDGSLYVFDSEDEEFYLSQMVQHGSLESEDLNNGGSEEENGWEEDDIWLAGVDCEDMGDIGGEINQYDLPTQEDDIWLAGIDCDDVGDTGGEINQYDLPTQEDNSFRNENGLMTNETVDDNQSLVMTNEDDNQSVVIKTASNNTSIVMESAAEVVDDRFKKKEESPKTKYSQVTSKVGSKYYTSESDISVGQTALCNKNKQNGCSDDQSLSTEDVFNAPTQVDVAVSDSDDTEPYLAPTLNDDDEWCQDGHASKIPKQKIDEGTTCDDFDPYEISTQEIVYDPDDDDPFCVQTMASELPQDASTARKMKFNKGKAREESADVENISSHNNYDENDDEDDEDSDDPYNASTQVICYDSDDSDPFCAPTLAFEGPPDVNSGLNMTPTTRPKKRKSRTSQKSSINRGSINRGHTSPCDEDSDDDPYNASTQVICYDSEDSDPFCTPTLAFEGPPDVNSGLNMTPRVTKRKKSSSNHESPARRAPLLMTSSSSDDESLMYDQHTQIEVAESVDENDPYLQQTQVMVEGRAKDEHSNCQTSKDDDRQHNFNSKLPLFLSKGAKRKIKVATGRINGNSDGSHQPPNENDIGYNYDGDTSSTDESGDDCHRQDLIFSKAKRLRTVRVDSKVSKEIDHAGSEKEEVHKHKQHSGIASNKKLDDNQDAISSNSKPVGEAYFQLTQETVSVDRTPVDGLTAFSTNVGGDGGSDDDDDNDDSDISMLTTQVPQVKSNTQENKPEHVKTQVDSKGDKDNDDDDGDVFMLPTQVLLESNRKENELDNNDDNGDENDDAYFQPTQIINNELSSNEKEVDYEQPSACRIDGEGQPENKVEMVYSEDEAYNQQTQVFCPALSKKIVEYGQQDLIQNKNKENEENLRVGRVMNVDSNSDNQAAQITDKVTPPRPVNDIHDQSETCVEEPCGPVKQMLETRTHQGKRLGNCKTGQDIVFGETQSNVSGSNKSSGNGISFSSSLKAPSPQAGGAAFSENEKDMNSLDDGSRLSGIIDRLKRKLKIKEEGKKDSYMKERIKVDAKSRVDGRKEHKWMSAVPTKTSLQTNKQQAFSSGSRTGKKGLKRSNSSIEQVVTSKRSRKERSKSSDSSVGLNDKIKAARLIMERRGMPPQRSHAQGPSYGHNSNNINNDPHSLKHTAVANKTSNNSNSHPKQKEFVKHTDKQGHSLKFLGHANVENLSSFREIQPEGQPLEGLSEKGHFVQPFTEKTNKSKWQPAHEKDKTVKPTSHEKDKTVKPSSHEKDKTVKPTSHEKDKTVKPTSHEKDKTVKPSSHEKDKTVKPSSHEKDKTVKPTSHEKDKTVKPSSHKKDKTLKPTSHEKDKTLQPTSHEKVKTLKPTSHEKGKTLQPSAHSEKLPAVISTHQVNHIAASRNLGVDEPGKFSVMKKTSHTATSQESLTVKPSHITPAPSSTNLNGHQHGILKRPGKADQPYPILVKPGVIPTTVKKTITINESRNKVMTFIPPANISGMMRDPAQRHQSPRPHVAPSKGQLLQSSNYRTDMIKSLLRWNPGWLDEQANSRDPPPILGDNKTDWERLEGLRLYYRSPREYAEITSHLLKLEIWQAIFNNWRSEVKNRPASDVSKVLHLRHLQSLNPTMSNESEICTYRMEGYCTVQGFFLNSGDVLMLKAENENAKNRDGNILRQFAYVKGFHKIDSHRLGTDTRKVVVSQRVVTAFNITLETKHRLVAASKGSLTAVKLCSVVSDERQMDVLSSVQHNGFLGKLVADPRQHKTIYYHQYVADTPHPASAYKKRICLATPSNAAVDELAQRIITFSQKLQRAGKQKIKMVRFGRGSIDFNIRRYSLKNLTEERALIVAEKNADESVRTEIRGLKEKMKDLESRIQNPGSSEIQRTSMKVEQGKLQKKLKSLQVKPSYQDYCTAERQVLQESHVVCGTLNSFGQPCPTLSRLDGGKPFGCIIIDEATQAKEVECLIPLQFKCEKLVLVGDPKQLQPTVLSHKAQEKQLDRSLFTRLLECLTMSPGHGDGQTTVSPVLSLRRQYRMADAILQFPNEAFYEGKLFTDEAVEEKRKSNPYKLEQYLVFDIKDSSEKEGIHAESMSLSNPVEADCVRDLCELVNSSIRKAADRQNRSACQERIGVISPYRGQKKEIERQLQNRDLRRIAVETVDAFQGQEKDVIIMSCVRAQSSQSTVGFLAEKERMNVSLTRAKLALYILGNFNTLRSDPLWKALYEHAKTKGRLVQVQTARDFLRIAEGKVKTS